MNSNTLHRIRSGLFQSLAIVCITLSACTADDGDNAHAALRQNESTGIMLLELDGNQVALHQAGRQFAYTTSRGDLIAAEIEPWTAYFDNDVTLDSRNAGNLKVNVEQLDHRSARIRFEHPDIAVTMAVRLEKDCIEWEPVQVENKSDLILTGLRYPAAAYHPLSRDMLLLAPYWGGYCYTYQYLAEGGSREEGMPAGTHDLLVIEKKDLACGIYSVQPIGDDLFHPNRFYIVGDRAVESGLTGLGHTVRTWLEPGNTESLPAVRLAVGRDAFDIFNAYRRDNRMDSWADLDEKMSDATFNVMAQAVHFKVGLGADSDFDQAASLIESLPAGPYLHEVVGYWAPGAAFDQYYPDFTDIAEKFGGEIGLKQLVATAHARGDLMSCYTNPTWWQPDSVTVKALGGSEAIGLKDRQGKVEFNEFGDKSGFVVGVWREKVQQTVREQLKTFRDRFNMDLVFQDQYGTRSHYEFSPDFGQVPYAYHDGLIELARISGDVLPVAGEGVGFDRAFRYLSGTMGFYMNTLTGERSWSYDEPRQRGHLQQWPLGTLVLHDKIAFYTHNLDMPVRTSENVSWTLAFGMNMHYTTWALREDRAAGRGNDTLIAISHIQKRIGSQAFGRRATGFRFLDDGLNVSVTEYENGLAVYTSHVNAVRRLTTPAGDLDLAPHGFVAVIGDQPICALLADATNPAGVIFDYPTGATGWQKVIDWKPSSITGR